MKKYSLIAFVLSLTLTLSADELAWVDTQIKAIKPPRKGVSSSSIANINSPFIFLEKNKSKEKAKSAKRPVKTTAPSLNTPGEAIVSSKKEKSKKLVLSAIINSSALINGIWYKLKDKVYTYKLSSVDRTSVVLTEGKRKLVLSTDDTKRNLKFKNK